jgi:hypothetical protein
VDGEEWWETPVSSDALELDQCQKMRAQPIQTTSRQSRAGAHDHQEYPNAPMDIWLRQIVPALSLALILAVNDSSMLVNIGTFVDYQLRRHLYLPVLAEHCDSSIVAEVVG